MNKLILQLDNPKLRQIANTIPLDQIQSKRIKAIVNKMKIALENESDGVAIAAPQIGENERIFVISKRINSILGEIDSKKNFNLINEFVYINPVIIKISKTKKKMEEGCLSVRWLYGEVERSDKATVQAFDISGKKFQKGASGLLAQIFQHEIDHLNGILFIDKAKNIVDIPPKQNEKS